MPAAIPVNTKFVNSYQSEDEILISSARHGDLEAFNQLVLKYQNLAYHHANTLLRDSFLAEDAAQEGFIKAFQNIRNFRGGSFRAWLLRIVTNTAYDMLRKSQRQPTQPLFPLNEHGEEIESVSWLADPATSVQETVERKELTAELYRLLDELPEAYRSVLTLIDISEMDYAEAAQVLNIPLGTIKSRIARARLRVKNKLLEQVYKENFFLDGVGYSTNTKTREHKAVCTNRNAENHPPYHNQNGTIQGMRASTSL